MSEQLDISPLEDAIDQLRKAIDFSTSDLAKSDAELFEQFRNSTVQCYEFTFELSWKFIKRKIELEHPSPDQVDRWGYKELIREAAVRGLIRSPDLWFDFRRYRNLSSHTYDRSKANQVYSSASDLLDASTFLLTQLKQV